VKNLSRGITVSLLVLLVIASAVFAKFLVENNFFTRSAVAQRYPYLQPFPSTSQQQPQQNPPSQNTAISVFSNNNNNNRLAACSNQASQKQGTIPPFCVGHLTVIKQVQGGNALPSQFDMHVIGNNPSQSSFAGSSSGTPITLGPGTYQVSENLSPGYSPSLSTECSGTISEGQSKICIITNTFSVAHLTVIKHVINDNGGTRTSKDFTISVSGNNVSPQSTFAGAESPGTSVTLSPGSFSVSETGPAGYTQSLSGDCSGTINAGDRKVCTITNNDNPSQSNEKARLIVIKKVNGGHAQPSQFSMHVASDSPTTPTPDPFPGQDTPGTMVTFDAGQYAVTEYDTRQFLFYTADRSAGCVGTINPGETKTCIFTNTFAPPPSNSAHLTVIKRVDNTGCTSQCAQASNFDISVGGDIYDASPSAFQGSEQGTDITLAFVGTSGSYNVGENNQPQFVGKYRSSFSSECSGTAQAGDSKTCIITNTFTG
jgi:hypothetical protein